MIPNPFNTEYMRTFSAFLLGAALAGLGVSIYHDKYASKPEPPAVVELSPAEKLTVGTRAVEEARFELEKQLTDAERDRNRDIDYAIREQYVESYFKVLPSWVANEFTGIEFDPARTSDAHPLAWGRGHYNGRSFEWFGFVNDTGNLELKTSMSIEGGATHVVERGVWSETYCKKPEKRVCDYIGAFEDYILKDLEKELPKLSLTTKGTFLPR